MAEIENFKTEYNTRLHRSCSDVESIIKDFIEDVLAPIRNDLQDIQRDVNSGKYSNDEISDEIEGLMNRI